MLEEIEETLLHELIHLWQYNHPDDSIVIQPPHGKSLLNPLIRAFPAKGNNYGLTSAIVLNQWDDPKRSLDCWAALIIA
jgi:hypothetical protein